MLHACLDMKAIILGKYHYVLYFLVLAMQVNLQLEVLNLVSVLISFPLVNCLFFLHGVAAKDALDGGRKSETIICASTGWSSC